MTPEELLSMLNIAPEAKPAKDTSIAITETVGTQLPRSQFATAVDDFDIHHSHSVAMRSNCDTDEKKDAAADIFSAAHRQDNSIVAKCPDPQRQRFLETLIESSEWRSIRERSVGSVALSTAATETALDSFLSVKEHDSEPKVMSKSLTAAAMAQDALNKLVEFSRSVGSGIGDEEGQSDERDINATIEQFKRMRNNSDLRRIFEAAGKFRLAAQAKQRMKTNHGMDEITGVEMDGDIARLLPVELASLSDDMLELDTMRRIVERQASCRQFTGSDPADKGPVIVVVDESSSMDDEKIIKAKAFALAMAWIAKHQQRYIALVAFSNMGRERVLVMKPGKWDQAKLIEWLSDFLGGGTSAQVPLVEVPKRAFASENANGFDAPRGHTDMIVITDGKINISPTVADSFKRWKQTESVRLISLQIVDWSSRASDGNDLADVSDELHQVRGINLTEQGVTNCLGI